MARLKQIPKFATMPLEHWLQAPLQSSPMLPIGIWAKRSPNLRQYLGTLPIQANLSSAVTLESQVTTMHLCSSQLSINNLHAIL